MSIIDEEWTVDLGDLRNTAGDDSFPFLEQGSCRDGADMHRARARLAAAAPAMARLLLRAVGDAESDAILLPGGPTVCEWVEQVEALLRQAGAM